MNILLSLSKHREEGEFMDSEKTFVEERLMISLMLLKIYPCLKGYVYIKEGVKRILQDSSLKYNLHRRLYKDLSSNFKESEELIDRGMRHAINTGIKRKGIPAFEKNTKFHFSDSRPTPRELLIILAESIRFEWNKIKHNTQDYIVSCSKI